MKIAFKNFLTTLRRYKASSLLNVAGLTMAFTAFYVIMVQVWWELGYNRSIPDAERIYLVAPSGFWDKSGNSFAAQSPRPSCERLVERSPEIEAGGPLRAWFNTQPAWVMRNGDYVRMKLKVITASTGFIETMRATAAAGDLTDFVRPNTLLLARSEAERMGVGVGDAVWLADNPFRAAEVRPDRQYEVVGIYDDFPANSGLAEIEAMVDIGDDGMNEPNTWNDTFFVRLREGTDPAAIARRWSEINAEVQAAWAAKMRPLWIEQYGQEEVDSWDNDDDQTGCRLMPLSELYFERALESSHWNPGSRPTTLSLLAVALLVVAIALINFVNFFFALTPARLRTVNIFKVFGAPTASLRFSFLFEAAGFVLVSLLLSWYVASALRSTLLAEYISTSLALTDNLDVLLLETGVALAAALAAGIYPAWYITSFNPALAAKGSFAGSRGGRRLRTALVAVQYVVSIVLIVFTFFCYAQHRFERRFDLGFEREQVLTFDAPRKIAAQPQSYEALVSRLAADPRIEGVTASQSPFVSDASTVWGRKWKGEEVDVHVRMVRPNFPEVMRIPMLEGGLRPEHGRDSIYHAIVPRSVADRFDFRPGEIVDNYISIAGISGDLQFRPLQYETKPLMMIADNKATRIVYLRIAPGSDIENVCDGIRRAIGEVDPDNKAPDIRFMNEQIDDLYEKENRLMTVIALFALLAVVIALMGVFGLVLFETQHRRREIAVRKVMGATTDEILAMFNRRYVVITLVCFAVAAPAAWWGVERWLSRFAYRVPVSPWIFLAALAAVLAVTVATVTLRSLSAARSNPADAVKSE